MRTSLRPIVPRPLAAAAVLAAALPFALAVTGCGGTAEPESRPAPAAGAAAPEAAGAPEATEPAETTATFETTETAPSEAAPANASPTAALEPSAAVPPAAAEPPARRRREPKPVVVEPLSEWTIDESLPTPMDLVNHEILAKFPTDDGRMVVIYRRDGQVFRRIQGKMGSLTLVEESIVDMEKLEAEQASESAKPEEPEPPGTPRR